MSTFEWLTLIGVLLGGFWILADRLAKIERTLVGKVTYEDCSRKRDNCPCKEELKQLKERMEK